MPFQETFDINHYYYHFVIVHLFTVDINRFHIILKKGVNLSQPKKRKNHMFV